MADTEQTTPTPGCDEEKTEVSELMTDLLKHVVEELTS